MANDIARLASSYVCYTVFSKNFKIIFKLEHLGKK